MSFELRRLTAEDAAAVRALETMAFFSGRERTPTGENANQTDAELVGTRWGIFEGGTMRSTLEVCPFRSHWGTETALPMGGVSSVATSPESRGQGHVDALLRHALLEMREAGQVVSALYPFSWSFYRKYGWDWVGEKREVTIPLTELSKAAEGRDVVTVAAEGYREMLAAGYTAYARQFRGAHTVDCHRWGAFRPSDGRMTYIYQYAPTGEYLAWQYEGEDRRGRVREWAVWTPEGHRALLSLLHHLANQCQTATVTLPADALLPQFLMHWDLKMKTEPMFAARVVDAAAALRTLGTIPGVANGALRLALHDPFAPWNEGVHAVAIESGAVHLSRLTDVATEDAGIEMDIQAFSQTFWGTPSLDQIRAAGRIIVRDETAFATLRTILPRATVFTMDFF